ncbi:MULTISPECIES: gamma-glutamyl-gamma-aminobutyrate hydrolase family protein [Brevibacterium]|uniref:Putative glutamine amidotransferase n=1 Tax=Brevibacterium antiquum CNRZ 918 TaxID=1255637 RepID=A0A2H1ITG4_9MICO|nr:MULTISPECIES: gamma-glutamyl-gamma-aminobutyrate hydrolase family protein [Brevibacterium]SMX78272.1 putative glutamine amidotransferase [Brevibacterium antiquum CNRZ 918]HCG55727.1 gamma-glutamyl-gamma-aminobutyrate hydrolase family protein [Brevibacterium sp.]
MASSDSDPTPVRADLDPPTRRPLIGLPTYYGRGQFGVWDRDAAFLPSVYVTAVTRAGGRAVLLPPEGPWALSEVAELDGLILTGGDDVDPGLYEARAHPRTQVPNVRRDSFETTLYRHARTANVPVFAICRGAQIVNTVHGGTLHQHLPDLDGYGAHEAEKKDEFAEVEVATTPDTAVAGLIGTEATVRCHHHQAIDDLGAGLIVSARSDDGCIEALETPDGSMLAVQWHPEETLEDLRLFTGLVEAAACRVKTTTTTTLQTPTEAHR